MSLCCLQCVRTHPVEQRAVLGADVLCGPDLLIALEACDMCNLLLIGGAKCGNKREAIAVRMWNVIKRQ